MPVSSKLFLLLITMMALGSCAKHAAMNAYAEPLKREYKYGPDSTYSRALDRRGNKLYIGNSDGFVYKLNLRSGKSRKVSTHALPELRDIAVTGRNKVVAMQSGDTSRVLLINGQKETVLSVSNVPVFLDGMDILPSGTGFMMGDPVGGYFSLYKTSNSGQTWTEITPKLQAAEGEAGFAASGTNVQCLNDSTFLFVSGGMQSRFFKTTNAGKTWTVVPLDFDKSPGSGPFSVHFMNEREGIAVGGDYTQPERKEKTCFYTQDGGTTWKRSPESPSGYKSCVIETKTLTYACGTSGTDYSTDKGATWHLYSHGNCFAMFTWKNHVYASFPNGQIIEL